MLGALPYIVASFICPNDAPTSARERSSNGSGNNAAPIVGCGSRCDAGTKPPGDSRHPGDCGRVRESAGRRPDPELPGRVLSHHPRFPAMAADAARPLPGHGPRVLHRQHPCGAAARCDVARDGGWLQRSQEAISGTEAMLPETKEFHAYLTDMCRNA